MRLILSLYILMFLSVTNAACLTSGSTATCSGNFTPTEFPISYSANVDGIEQILLDGTVNALIDDRAGFILRNDNALLSFDLSVFLEQGGLIDKAGTQPDPIYLLNRGSGNNLISISGTVRTNPNDAGVHRGVRLWASGVTSTDSNTIEVTSSGVIDTMQTCAWIRNQGLGPSYAIINGNLLCGEIGRVGGFRGIHISHNNPLSTEPVIIEVGADASVSSNFQTLFTSNEGAGLVRFDIHGSVFSGAFPVNQDPPAAIVMENESGGGLVNIYDGGSVESLNDLAVFDADYTRNILIESSIQIVNNGLIWGYVDLGGGDDSFTNDSSNSFNFRDFRDGDFDGTRDTENVAVSNFGVGNDSFINTTNGTLRLSRVQDDNGQAVSDFNTTSVMEYFATGSAALTNTVNGIEQGHFVGLESFSNAGLITLADTETGGIEPVAGDTFVITASDIAGTAGVGDFISEGGALHLDVKLDDGQIDTTDVLVVDNATTGSGPTVISLTNAGGLGAATNHGATDGILVVEVLGASSADAFVLEGDTIQVGGFGYFLTRADGKNWYLQSVALPNISANDVGPTYNPFPLLSGTTDVSDGQLVTIIDGDNALVCESLVEAGEWSCTANTEIAAGSYTYTASVSDNFGNTATIDFRVVILEALAPTVEIVEDVNNDGVIDYTELNGEVDVVIILPANASEGDVLMVEQGGSSENIVLTAAMISNGQLELSFETPANGELITVTALVQLGDGTQSPSSEDSATLNAITPFITGNDVSDTYNTQPELTGTTNMPNGTLVTVSDSNGDSICTATVLDGQWSCTPTEGLPLGDNILSVSAQDSLGNTFSDSFSASIIDGGALETSVNGHGGGSSSWWLLIVLAVAGLFKLRPRSGALIGVLALFVFPLTMQASDSNKDVDTENDYNRWFLGVGYGLSKLQPEGESFGWSLEDDNSHGFKVFLGRPLSKRWGLELSYADIGKAELGHTDALINASANPAIDYKASSLMLSYDFYRPSEQWKLYGKFGVSDIRNSVNTDLVRYEKQHSAQFALGIGALYHFNEDWFFRVEVESYDTDANFSSLQIGRYLGGSSKSKHTPAYISELKKEKEQIKPLIKYVPEVKQEKTKVSAHKKEQGRTLMEADKRIYFEIDSDTLTTESQQKIKWIIESVNQAQNPVKITLIGHTDSSFTEQYNLSLSNRRALATKDFLVANKIPQASIDISYLGEEYPIASNETKEGRARNRRVEILIKELGSAQKTVSFH